MTAEVRVKSFPMETLHILGSQAVLGLVE